MARGNGENKTSPRRIKVAWRRAEVLKLRAQGKTYPEILRERPDFGYRTHQAIAQDVRRALAETVGEPAAELRALEALRLDQQLQRVAAAELKVVEVLNRRHVTVSQGRVIYLDGESEPLEDDGPVLQAVGQLKGLEELRLKIADRRTKLFGLDAPAKVAMLTDDDLDRIEQGLRAELDDLNGNLGDADAAETGEDPEDSGAEG